MAFYDLSLVELKGYKPERVEPNDFDLFWQESLKETRSHDLDARFEPADFHLKTVETFDVTFNGYGGQAIKGWLILPRERKGKLPCVVEYIGYGGGRSFPTRWLLWASAGYAHLVMDTRGQGSEWAPGDTPDIQPNGSSVHVPGFMTLGVLDPKTYYYRRLFCDGVRAVEAAQSHPDVDAERIATSGASQGGGLTLAVSGLLSEQVKVAMPDVPYLCHFRRATQLVDSAPYNEIVRYCNTHRDKVEQVFNTLSYFDGLNFAARAKAQALFSVGLMDDICPPSTVFAAYNHYAGKKELRVYEYNRHEGGEMYQDKEKVELLNKLWG